MRPAMMRHIAPTTVGRMKQHGILRLQENKLDHFMLQSLYTYVYTREWLLKISIFKCLKLSFLLIISSGAGWSFQIFLSGMRLLFSCTMFVSHIQLRYVTESLTFKHSSWLPDVLCTFQYLEHIATRCPPLEGTLVPQSMWPYGRDTCPIFYCYENNLWLCKGDLNCRETVQKE